MITLACAKCGTTLRVDDGFAGGVCRCNRCGTIQTVPIPSTGTAAATASTAPARAAGKAIYERTGRADGTDRDLAQLGEIVTSSGAFGSSSGLRGGGPGMRGRRQRDPTQDLDSLNGQVHATRATWPLVLTVIAAALVICGVGVGLWLGSRRPAPPANVTPDANRAAADAPVPTGPRFGTVALTEIAPVVYLIDRDALTHDQLPAIRATILRSAGTLRAPRAFQIRFVAPPTEGIAAFPAVGAQVQSAALLLRAGEFLDAAPAARDSSPHDVAASLEAALGTRPGEIIYITANAQRLASDEFVGRITGALGRSPEVRLHVLSIGPADAATAIRPIVDASRGQLITVDRGQPLTDFARR